MLALYSYIFNVVYKSYSKSGDEHPGIYSVGIVSLLPFFTITEMFLLPTRLKHYKVDATTFGVLLFGSIVFLNYLYFYIINTPKKISDKVELYSDNKKRTLKYLTWAHVVITVGLFIYIASLPSDK